MDEQLLTEIRAFVRCQKHTRELDRELSDATRVQVESKFIDYPRSIWWWENLRSPSRIVDYGASDAFEEIRKLIKKDEIVRLVVTDDESPPWPVFEGPTEEILAVVSEHRFFEYFLVPGNGTNLDWIIFDTHLNQLVVAEAGR